MDDKARIAQLQARCRQHNEHILKLAQDRDRYRQALQELGYTADQDGNPMPISEWDSNHNGSIDTTEELEAYAALMQDDSVYACLKHKIPAYRQVCALCLAERDTLDVPDTVKAAETWGQYPLRIAHKRCRQDYVGKQADCPCPDPKNKCLYKSGNKGSK